MNDFKYFLYFSLSVSPSHSLLDHSRSFSLLLSLPVSLPLRLCLRLSLSLSRCLSLFLPLSFSLSLSLSLYVSLSFYVSLFLFQICGGSWRGRSGGLCYTLPRYTLNLACGYTSLFRVQGSGLDPSPAR